MRWHLMVSLLFLGGCMVDPPPEYRPCRCDVEVCSADACGYQISMDSSCDADVPFAEILVDDHLEVMDLIPGETVQLCSRTEPGDSATIYVRGGSWIWGPINRKCEGEGGQTYSLVLECADPEE